MWLPSANAVCRPFVWDGWRGDVDSTRRALAHIGRLIATTASSSPIYFLTCITCETKDGLGRHWALLSSRALS